MVLRYRLLIDSTPRRGDELHLSLLSCIRARKGQFTMPTMTDALTEAMTEVQCDIAWLSAAPKAWSAFASEALAFGEAIESRDLVKYASRIAPFVAAMAPLLAALLEWKAAPSLELGLACKTAARAIFAAAKRLAQPEDLGTAECLGSKRLARLQKAADALVAMGEESSLAVCLEDEDNTPTTWAEAGPGAHYVAAPETYEVEDAWVDDDDAA